MHETNLLYLQIQPDFKDCIEDVAAGKLSKEHFYINVQSDPYTLQDEQNIQIFKNKADELTFSKNFQKLSENHYSFALANNPSVNNDEWRVQFITSKKSNKDTQGLEKDYTSLAISHERNSFVVLGDSLGNISVLNNGISEKIKTFDGAHEEEITCLKVFPSNKVLLSGSMDMKIKIWSLDDGGNPRTFTGHRQTITELSLIERGRNFISCSKDGTIKLWECGSGKCLHTFSRKENKYDGIQCMALLSGQNEETTQTANELEFGTEGKKVVAGHCSGVITCHDLYTKRQIFQIPSLFTSPCTAITNFSQNFIVSGYENGTIALWNLNSLERPVKVFSFQKGTPINKLVTYNSKTVFVSSGIDANIVFDITGKDGDYHVEYLVCEDKTIKSFEINQISGDLYVAGSQGLCSVYSI
ncbi:related to 26S proteasome regulatory subunit RPN14 [Saccharomycodes ludwigii]|uniref:Related to 26S proteasome regulatory subunit RPN14 n=1 Tax=Saccharomycodes ludwigii TaxID=36035 RepID=A0A376BB03_9ASCO|nr:hypothetical protein SCDLUD_001505 [Saccharomycodes ludwigii]KAH3901732.1 hypothetical protein SCDLUD_001505 [Saccharomycodes ludwigii]SSD61781.1 related to 26S proteasome regulatory subunit RPN14 [Saccharomycodes ludwigii]